MILMGSFLLRFVRPPKIIVVHHQFRHTPIYGDILTGDETAFRTAQEHYGIDNVGGSAHAAGGVLIGIWTLECSAGGVDPARGNGVHPRFSGQRYGYGMGQGADAAFGGRIAFGVSLAHQMPGGGDIDDTGLRVEVLLKQLRQKEGRCDANPQNVVEFVVGAGIQSSAREAGVVDQVVDRAIIRDHLCRKAPQGVFIGDVTDEVIVVEQVDGADGGALLSKSIAYRFADAPGSARNDGYFWFIHGKVFPFIKRLNQDQTRSDPRNPRAA